jgi:hypothetical protein
MAHNALKRLIDHDDKLKLAVNRILAGNSSGFASAVSLTGDVTLGSAGSITIGNGKVTSAMIGASAIPTTKIRYTDLSITIVGSTAGSTSNYGTAVITSNAKLFGIWLTAFNSLTDYGGSFAWRVSYLSALLRIDVNGPNPAPTGNKLVFKGVVIEP